MKPRHHEPAAQQGMVDFTLMYAAHDAFERDLRRLAAAAAADRAADPAVRAGWLTFKRQLHIHHSTVDAWLWPRLREKATPAADAAVLDQMKAEHARIDPLMDQSDASINGGTTWA